MRGVEPILLGQTAANLAEAAEAVSTILGRPVDTHLVDVADYGSVSAVADRIAARHLSLAGLINNAGVIDPIAPLTEADAHEWARNIAINLIGPFNLIRALSGRLLPGGFVVNISSGAAEADHLGWSAYAAAKAGLERMTSTLQVERPDLRVETFRPGVTATKMQQTIRASAVDNAIRRLPQEALQPPEKPADLLVGRLLGASA